VTEAIRERQGGLLNELDHTLLHSIPVAAGWSVHLDALRTQTSIQADLRELAICRVAALNSAWFKWKHHYYLVLEAGVDDTLMALVKSGREWELSGMQDMECGTLRWTVLRYVGSMTLNVKVLYREGICRVDCHYCIL
jgi:alkylhydroperoxidase family enzyme